MKELLKLYAEEIDCSGSWLFWSEEPSQDFKQSIESLGQLEPVLASHESGQWHLVSGYKRLQAIRDLHIPVDVLSISVKEKLDKGKVYFLANWRQGRGLSELVPAIRFFSDFLNANELRRLFAKEFGLHLTPQEIKRTFSWLNLPAEWITYLINGALSIEVGEYLSKFNPAEINCLQPFLDNLHWSRNNFKKLVAWLFELTQINTNSLSDLVEDLKLHEILEQEYSPKEKIRNILIRVKAKRFPELVSLEKKFCKLKKEVCQSSHWQVQPEQNFEANTLYLKTKIKSRSDLGLVIKELESLFKKEKLNELLNFAERFA